MLIQQALIQKAPNGQIAGTNMLPGPSTHEVLSSSFSLSLCRSVSVLPLCLACKWCVASGQDGGGQGRGPAES